MVEIYKHEELLNHERVERADFDLPMHWIHVHNNEPGWIVPDHWHEELEVSFTVNGSLKGYRINGEEFNTRPGDVLLVRPGDVHCVATQAPDPERDILTIFFDSKILLQDVPNIKQLKFYLHPNSVNKEEAKKLQTDLMAFYHAIHRDETDPTRKLELKKLMYDLLHRIVTSFGYVSEDSNLRIDSTGMSSELMQDIVQYIKEHVQEDIRVQDLADEFNISPSYLTRSFKRYLDRTPTAYIQLMKINVATQYLINTDHSVQYVADLSGFGSLRSFERAFKEQYDRTPTEYRRERKINI
ncbi:AraC family transcriptional regulator [Weissella ceti]|uniref:AraC family transcriptional regulator n=1 Tax=Weissella ceti TaxID=759620 RepID=A0ABT3E342_9LACO|nr:AraC family transcriptional regulator [Weissella ceti]MCW0952838.1 AraC family transcriptional regulator [Weissella ceti]QVK12535.1 helix-turn-helix transcriptional regulator [Weissella ceti]